MSYLLSNNYFFSLFNFFFIFFCIKIGINELSFIYSLFIIFFLLYTYLLFRMKEKKMALVHFTIPMVKNI